MSKFEIGDRVEHILCSAPASYGTIEYVADDHVRVRYDDGKIGLLFNGGTTFAQIKHLQKLVNKKGTKNV